jgi:hypothetical protein
LDHDFFNHYPRGFPGNRLMDQFANGIQGMVEAVDDFKGQGGVALFGPAQNAFKTVGDGLDVRQAQHSGLALEAVGLPEQFLQHPLVLGILLQLQQTLVQMLQAFFAFGAKEGQEFLIFNQRLTSRN